MSHIYLKIKVKSLAAEAKIIRKEEKRFPQTHVIREGLFHHRICDVRKEQRSSFIAYGYLRGRPYKVIEECPKTKPDWQRVARMVAKYGSPEQVDKFPVWAGIN